MSTGRLELILEFCADHGGKWPTTGELAGLVTREPHLNHSRTKDDDMASSTAKRVAEYIYTKA